MSKALTQDEFITKCKAKHGNKYDYSKTKFTRTRDKVVIICPEHGEFLQTACEHLRGCGCPKCLGKIMTQEEFVLKSKMVHGDAFDYSKSVYNGSRKPITIICRKHGEFITTPTKHIKYGGCPKCKQEKKRRYITRQDFVKQSKQIHGDKFDYSQLTELLQYYEKYNIVCRIHGTFKITPYEHIELHKGCPKCNGKGLTTNEWIERFRSVHGGKYDYSKFIYNKSDVKSIIICPKHGEFWQTPTKHYNGRGCPKCKWEKLHDLNCKTTRQFINEAIVVHGEKYDYSKVEYIDNHTKVCIICPEHGEFWQLPTTHLNGGGCMKCATIADTSRKKDSIGDFICKARKTHGDRYDYSKVEYQGSMKQVCIICPEHGEFWQRPDSHINGKGCPKCGNHKTELKIGEILDSYGILYEYEKTFDWLRYQCKQRLDYYLPNNNAAIEYQGEQHFKPIDFGGKGNNVAQMQFYENTKRDTNKLQLCKQNGIRLFYITYQDDINQRLNEILRELNLI